MSNHVKVENKSSWNYLSIRFNWNSFKWLFSSVGLTKLASVYQETPTFGGADTVDDVSTQIVHVSICISRSKHRFLVFFSSSWLIFFKEKILHYKFSKFLSSIIFASLVAHYSCHHGIHSAHSTYRCCCTTKCCYLS